MRRVILIPMGIVALTVPVTVLAGSGGSGFNGVVHSIEARYHVKATHIPFLGLVSLVSRKATHGGVSSIHVAEIESFTEHVDGEELNQMVEEKLGPGWERIIRETNKNGNEQTLIFIRPEGERMGMFIVDKDKNEMDVVEISVDPNHLNDDIDHYRHHHDDDNDSSDGESPKGASN